MIVRCRWGRQKFIASVKNPPLGTFNSLLSNPFIFWFSFKKTKSFLFFDFLYKKITIECVNFIFHIGLKYLTLFASLQYC
jgi:hypothetical protein